MYKVYDKWPQIARESYESNLEPIDFKDIDHIVFSGMGGILSKLINLIYQLDFIAIYRAVLSGIDPSPIKSIDFVKSRL